MATTDERGRKKGNSDPRVSEAAKAEMPAYGFEGLTIGEIQDAKRAKLNQDAADGKTRLTTQDKKY